MSRSDPKRIVVTGANGGIGRPMCARLLEDGYRVAGLDLNGDRLEQLSADFPDRMWFLECDVSSTDDVEATVDEIDEKWGGVDILVNNAAMISGFAPLEELTVEQFQRAFEVNYFGYLRMIRAVLPGMRTRGAGVIHNVSSGTAIAGHPGLTHYASTKGAVESLTKSLRQELRDEEVACTVMHPPFTGTESARQLGMGYPDFATGDPEDIGRKLAARIEQTGPTIVPDFSTKASMVIIRWFPALFRWFLNRYIQLEDAER